MPRGRINVARNDRTNAGRSPPHANGELSWPSGNETTNRNIADAKRAENGLAFRRAAARGHARAGERTRPAGIATNPRGPGRVRAQDDEARVQPEGRGQRQSHQPGTAPAIPSREHGSDPHREGLADPRPPALPSAHLLARPDCRALAPGRGGDEGRRISQRRGPLPADWGCITSEAVRRRRRARHRPAPFIPSRPERTPFIASTATASCRSPKSTRSKDEGWPWRSLNGSSSAPDFGIAGTPGARTPSRSIRSEKLAEPSLFGES